MKDRAAIQRWALLGALASAMLLTGACEREWPETGSEFEGRPNEAQDLESFVEPDVLVEPPGTGGAGVEPEDVPLEEQGEPVHRPTQSSGGPGDQDSLGAPDFTPGDVRPPPEPGEPGAPFER